MPFNLVYSPECFAVASGRKSGRKLFSRATEMMGTTDQEFVGDSTSPCFAFLSYPFHMGISLLLGKRLPRVFLDTYGCEKHKFSSCANANFVYLAA